MGLQEFRENKGDITGAPAFPAIRAHFRALEEIAVNHVHVVAKEQELEDLFKGMRDGKVLGGGRQRRNGQNEYTDIDALYGRNDVLTDIMVQSIVSDLQARMAEWRIQLDEVLGELAENEEKLDDIDQLKELQENGDLDPDNPEHRYLLIKVGVDPDLEGEDLANAIRDREIALKARSDTLRRRAEELQTRLTQAEALLEDMQNGRGFERTSSGDFTNPTVQKAMTETERVLGEEYDANNMVHQQQFGDQLVTEISRSRAEQLEQSGLGATSIADDAVLSAEGRVEGYKTRYEAAQNIEDEQARLAAEKAIFDDIQKESMTFMFSAANDETLRPLFEPDRFAGLETTNVQTAAVTLENDLTAKG